MYWGSVILTKGLSLGGVGLWRYLGGAFLWWLGFAGFVRRVSGGGGACMTVRGAVLCLLSVLGWVAGNSGRRII